MKITQGLPGRKVLATSRVSTYKNETCTSAKSVRPIDQGNRVSKRRAHTGSKAWFSHSHRKVNNVGVLFEVKPNMKSVKVPQL